MLKVQALLEEVRKAAPHAECVLRKEFLAPKTGAKVYFLGGGWWGIGGYAHDNSDAVRTLDLFLK